MPSPKSGLLAVALTTGALFSAVSPAVPAAETEQSVISGNEGRLLSGVRQLTFEGKRAGEGYFGADGRKMVFQSEREPGNPFYQIYLMDLETGDTSRVSPGVGQTTCAWIHPSGEKVLFASTHEDPGAAETQRLELEKRASGKASRYSWSFDEHYDIFEADTRAGTLRNLTHTPGYDAEGSWSPDGSRIVFASNRDAYQRVLTPEEQRIFEHDKSYFMDLYLMDADGQNVKRLTDAPGYDGGPFFSADGESIVWRRFSTDGATAEVWTMKADGSQPRQVTHLGAMSWAPYFHPSGDYIIFATNLQGHANFELYLVDSEGRSPPVRVTDTPGFDGLPVFTPDGGGLAWTSSRTPDGSAQIFMAKWNDAEARGLLGLQQATAAAPREGASDVGPLQADIAPEDMRRHVNYLASDELEGRFTGSPGERLATEYVASAFQGFGLEPAGDDGTFFQPFEFTAGVSLNPGNRLTVKSGGVPRNLEVDRDWRPLAFSRNGDVGPAPVVFAGYGIVAPASGEFPAYDAYAGLDVAGKWVMVLRYLPEDIAPEYRQHLSNYFELRYKAMVARDKGALGLILVSGPNSGVKEQLVKLSFDTALAATSIAAISVTDDTADLLLRSGGENLKALQDRLDKGEAVPGFTIPGVQVEAAVDLKQEKRTGRNVLARLASGHGDGPMVVIGAHVDHLGRAEGSDSLARPEERGQVHPGADDNASGVAGLLEVAQYLTDLKARGQLDLRRDVLFAAWSGEELGLLGSTHFVDALAGQSDNLRSRVAAYLNMDMIGRLDRQLYLQGVGSSSRWAGEIERRNVPIGLSVALQNDTYLSTDATAFYLKGVPVLSAFTGAHPEYNTPRDRPDTLNYQGAAQVARLMGSIARDLATDEGTPDYVATEKPTGSPSRRNLRAYLGTIPEYGASDVKGVKLGGVASGAPAAEAGLKPGDVIVELAGRSIENIYDYTYALNALKVGQPVQVVVERVGERVALTVTPGARE